MKLSVDQALARAKRLARNGEVLEAEKLFGEIVNAYPKNLRARQALAALRGSGSSAVRASETLGRPTPTGDPL
ncbi:MAG: hypothetical protein OSB69_07545, partial [Alphaproteobacteria bacterium]|nr:hypothetical protein [Alphaproteobacteria bacterium]